MLITCFTDYKLQSQQQSLNPHHILLTILKPSHPKYLTVTKTQDMRNYHTVHLIFTLIQ